MDSVEHLRRARALIERPAGFCRGWMARRPDGTPCAIHDAQASCWSIEGAFWRVIDLDGLTESEEQAVWQQYLQLQKAAEPWHGMAALGDRYGHAAALRFYDSVIGLLSVPLPRPMPGGLVQRLTHLETQAPHPIAS